MALKKSYRKTNLFYTSGQDSNFLTFSNYTESLTGSFLATDWKVYPAKFLCLYIPSLLDENGFINIDKKKEFIKDYLISYYENKLAFLRDYYYNLEINEEENTVKEEINKKIEDNIHSFNWLLNTIRLFDPNSEITFAGEVTELDYNGVYADTICIIDGTQKSINGSIIIDENTDNIIKYNSTSSLYGWDDSELSSINIEDYNEFNLKFDLNTDEENFYNSDNCSSLIKNLNSEEGSIKFNIVIPLYDIVNMDYLDNFDQIDEDETVLDELIKELDANIDLASKRSINNPLGIWFSEKLITLDRDEELKYSPSWSLVISSQFKPFPYSLDYKDMGFSLRDDKHAFATYAQILANQKDFTKLINDLYLQYDALKEKIAEYIRIVNNITNSSENGGIDLSEISLLINRIGLLENKISELSEIKNRLSIIENNFVELRTEVNNNTNNINNILSRLENIENTIANISTASGSGEINWKTNYTE